MLGKPDIEIVLGIPGNVSAYCRCDAMQKRPIRVRSASVISLICSSLPFTAVDDSWLAGLPSGKGVEPDGRDQPATQEDDGPTTEGRAQPYSEVLKSLLHASSPPVGLQALEDLADYYSDLSLERIDGLLL
jgi:hypothetical protein